MTGIHIICLVEMAIALFTVSVIINKHNKNRLISNDRDFIDAFVEKKEKDIMKQGVSFSVIWYLRIMIIAPLALGVIAFVVTQRGLLAVVVGAIGLLVPEILVRILAYDANKKAEEYYARSLQQLSASLRAGMSIAQAVADVANCVFLHESMRMRYAKMNSELQMGLTISEAFRHFAEDFKHQDAYDVALAIEVQNEVGGHEAEVIQEIATNIYNRIMLRREVNSIFAGSSMMVIVFDILPIAVMLIFTMSNNTFVDIYFSNVLYMLVFVLLFVLPIVGGFVNHRILDRIKKGV